MSKKILKRSLALGALMAFVITGSALAQDKISGDKTIPDGSVYKNNNGATTPERGGAIYHSNGTLKINNATFDANTAKKRGASIYANNSDITVTNTDFVNHAKSSVYSVIYLQNGSELILNGGNVFNNEESAVHVADSKVTFKNHNEFLNCTTSPTIILTEDDGTNNNTVSTMTFEEDSYTEFAGGIGYDIGDMKGRAVVDVMTDAIVESNGGVYGIGTLNLYGTLEIGADSYIKNLDGDGGTIKYLNNIKIDVDYNTATDLEFVADGTVNDAVNGDINKLIGDGFAASGVANFSLEEGTVVGAVDGTLEGVEVKDEEGNKKIVYRMKSSTEAPHEGNAAISNNANIAMMAWRAETNDMNKRLGELRNANGDLGVWVRMVGGEDEFKSVEYDYTQYQLGYDEKLSVDPSWTVGVALSYTDGESKFTDGSGENTHKGLSVYGSKLNDDGSFIDLIAKYSRLEHDLISNGDKGDYSTNGYSVSAEYGKRFQQGKGLWIEPQVELTYGKVKSAEYKLGDKTVSQDAMESLVGRIGFSLGKDIKQGNVYARASYLYDFEGETDMAFANSGARREFKYDLGGGWWEVGVGANINLSKATYIYADVEKTFGGEVDTNWQWNLGVRYSF